MQEDTVSKALGDRFDESRLNLNKPSVMVMSRGSVSTEMRAPGDSPAGSRLQADGMRAPGDEMKAPGDSRQDNYHD